MFPLVLLAYANLRLMQFCAKPETILTGTCKSGSHLG